MIGPRAANLFRRIFTAAAACALLAPIAGCRGGGRPGVFGQGDPDSAPPPASRFAIQPHSLRVHPLTRFAILPDQGPVLVLHVEFQDAFAHTVKALGQMRVELIRPGLDDAGGTAYDGVLGDEVSWDVDMRDPSVNAQMFDDLVTRTYSVTLAGLPDWVHAWIEQPDPGRGEFVLVRAAFTYIDAFGEERTIAGVGQIGR